MQHSKTFGTHDHGLTVVGMTLIKASVGVTGESATPYLAELIFKGDECRSKIFQVIDLDTAVEIVARSLPFLGQKVTAASRQGDMFFYRFENGNAFELEFSDI